MRHCLKTKLTRGNNKPGADNQEQVRVGEAGNGNKRRETLRKLETGKIDSEN